MDYALLPAVYPRSGINAIFIMADKYGGRLHTLDVCSVQPSTNKTSRRRQGRTANVSAVRGLKGTLSGRRPRNSLIGQIAKLPWHVLVSARFSNTSPLNVYPYNIPVVWRCY